MPPKDSPYIDHTGTMIIPFSADQKYHYWNGGQTLSGYLDRAEYNGRIFGGTISKKNTMGMRRELVGKIKRSRNNVKS